MKTIQFKPTISTQLPFNEYYIIYCRYADIIRQFCEEYKQSAN